MASFEEDAREALKALVAGVTSCPPDDRDGLMRTVMRIVFVLMAERLELWPPALRSLAQGGSDAFACLSTALARVGPLEPSVVDDTAVRDVVSKLIAVADTDEVERVGHVYESLLGFGIEVATGPSVALECRRKAGAAPTAALVDLDALLAKKGRQRARSLEKLSIDVSERMAQALERAADAGEAVKALRPRLSPLAPHTIEPGRMVVMPSVGRRRSGSHYSPSALTELVAKQTLSPTLAQLGDAPTADAIFRIKVCDPAMGSGAFLLAACRHLSTHLVQAWQREGKPQDLFEARRLVARHCLYGVDKNPFAVELAKLSLWLFVRAEEPPASFLEHGLRAGDSLVQHAFDWQAEFPEVFTAERGGFDAMIGNPPWVSYVGRAVQPLLPRVRDYFAEHYRAFAGYRNLQGIFIERAATLLRASGRLGFIVPSSMSDLDGYAPTRAAHDRLCTTDSPLTDLGTEAFPGVFQPCMALVSTRRAADRADAPAANWPLEETFLDSTGQALLAKMSQSQALPPHLFGERGVQTMGGDTEQLREAPGDDCPVPLRAGSDIAPFHRKAPSFYFDPRRMEARIRSDAEWQSVAVLFRQTARVPMATLSDGLPFRNSILAGFDDPAYPATFLVAYLNTTPIRWLHYARHRDARQGMPQLKVGHLRRTPAPPKAALVAELAELGKALSSKNAGLDAEAQEQLDGLVADAFALSAAERDFLRAWWRALA
jgi:hypothetical protein